MGLFRALAGHSGRVQARGPARRAAALWPARRLRRVLAAGLTPVLAAGTSLVPVAVTVAGAAAVSAVAVAVAATPARAASKTVLVLLQGGETAAPETAIAQAAGFAVTTVTPSAWAAMSASQFKSYAALVIGDPSSGTTCSALVPTTGTSGSDALGTTWQPAVTGNLAVAGTAPALAGTSSAKSLISAAISYAASGSATGLYESLNCEYATAAAGSTVPLLNGVEGIGGGGGLTVTGQGASCGAGNSTGTVNRLEAARAAAFNGLSSSALASSQWPSPACAVQETFSSWPASFTPVAYDASSGARGTANFTASDGQAGQPYVLLGAPVSAATAALAPTAGGEVPEATTAGGTNAAAPGVQQATAGDPVDTENGDFTQSDTDLSLPGFGPALDFSRTYDAATAQEQTQAGTPGPMGYGWTDSLASSLAVNQPTPGDIYALDGLATDTGNGGPAADGALSQPSSPFQSGGNIYVADAADNRIEEVAGSAGTQWGISMTAGHVYTIAGSDAGTAGDSPNATALASSRLHDPEGVTLDSTGNLYIADTGNNRVLEVPVAGGTQRGISMTAGDVYTIAGSVSGTAGHSGDSGAATSALLNQPIQVLADRTGSNPALEIADAGNNRVQYVFAAGGTDWESASYTANDIYTIAGSSSGTAGDAGDTSVANGGAFLDQPTGLCRSSAGDLYIADELNNQIREVPAANGTEWGQPMTASHLYTVVGLTAGTGGHSPNGTGATSAKLASPTGISCQGSTNLYISDSSDNEIQEVPGAAASAWGLSMTAGDIYTIAGSGTGGAGGYTGNGGAATSALLNYPFGGVTFDPSGDLYLADSFNNEIREVSAATFKISNFAGDGSLTQDGDGGPSTTAGLDNPGYVTFDSAGDLFISDTTSNRVQEIAARPHTQFGIAMTAGDVYTVAGSSAGFTGDSGDGGPATAATLSLPEALATDSAGDLYIADSGNGRIRKVSAATGDISAFAGQAGVLGDSGNGGPATSATLLQTEGLAVDAAGDVYISDGDANQIREVAAASGTQWGQSMTAGDIYLIAGDSGEGSGTSGDGAPAAAALLDGPEGISVSPPGDLYIADSENNRIQEIAARTGTQWGQPMTAGDIYTVAGNAAGTPGDAGTGGPARSATLNQPAIAVLDPAGDLDVADANNGQIREVAAANGTQWGQSMTAGDIYLIAGSAAGTFGETGNGGLATAATLDSPSGLAVDHDGNLYIPDSQGAQVREVTAATAIPFPLAPQASAIDITQPDGSTVTFYPQSGGTCTTPYVTAGQYCTLPQNISATLSLNSATQVYTYTPSPGTTYTYGWNGAMTSQADAAGDTLTIAYDTPAPGSGHCPSTAATCATATAASGRALVIGSNSAGLVTSVTDPLGRPWAYAYNAGGDLTTATDPMGHVTTYTYGQGSTGNALLAADLLTITSPNAQPGGPDAGDATVNVYDPSGRVTSQTSPAGWKTTFSYCVSTADGDCLNTATGTGYVTVTSPDANTTVDYYQQGALAAESAWTSGTTLTSENDSVPDLTAGGASGGTLLNAIVADGAGDTTSYSYNSDGNSTASTSPGANGTSATTTSAYTSALQDVSCDGTAEAAAAASCGQDTGPAAVAPGGVITPPSAAPPLGLTFALYDTAGNDLYSTNGVYEPGATSAAYSQTTYQLFNGNKVTLPNTSTQIACTSTAPSMSLPCATIDADGAVTQLQYNAQGDLTSSSMPDGNGSQLATTTDTYNGDGEQLTEVSPDGNVSGGNAGNYTTTTAYNADGEKTSVGRGSGAGFTDTPRTISYGFDADGNQTTVKDARGFATTTTFNADDKADLVTNPDGHAILTCYDGEGRTAQTVPPDGVAAGSLTAGSCPTAYPAGYTDRLAADATTAAYDAEGQRTTVTAPAPAGQSGLETTSYAYDGAGDLVKTTAPAVSSGGPAVVVTDTYGSAGDLASQTTGAGTSAAATISYCYDPNGDQTAMVAGDGNASGVANCETASPWVVSASSFPTQAAYQTTSAYDSAGERVSTTAPATSAAPGGATTTSTYDAAGNMLTRTDPDSVKTTWTYTPLDLASSVSYSGSSAHAVSYSYDADGNQTGMADATGSPSYVYDPFGELTSATNGAGHTTGYGYNADGRVSSITYPLPSTATWATSDAVSYGYDNADLLTSVSDFNGHQITLGSTADGLPSSEGLGSTGDTIATSYDPTDSASSITLKNSSSTLESFTYSDAPSGNILSEADAPPSAQSPAVYSYDAKGRVTSMTPGTGSAKSYSFDASTNLITLPTGATGTYDKAGELTSSAMSGTTTGYTYNADGEQLTATQGSSISSGTWNGAAQLTSYDNAAADMSAAAYDGKAMRASSTSTPAGGSAVTQGYVWNTVAQIPQLIMDSVSAYIYGDGNAPAEQVNLSTGVITYLVADSLGSVRGTVSSAGTLTGATSYDAWGNPHTAGGLTPTTPFGYAGGYTDPDGLIYLLNRYYSPATGQFISVDPDVADTLQPYAYASADPVRLTDPTGLRWWDYQTYKLECAGFCEDYYYDFSATYALEVDRAAEKIAHRIQTWGGLGTLLVNIINAVVNNHPEAKNIASIVLSAAALAAITVRWWLPRFLKIFKGTRNGSGKHAGFYWRNHYNWTGWHYGNIGWRSCPAEFGRCGTPGRVE